MTYFSNMLTGSTTALAAALFLAAAPVHADDGTTAGFDPMGLDYHSSPSLLSEMGNHTRVLVDSTLQNFRVFNQRLARSIDYTEFRMTAMDLPAPENWDYEYWDSVKEPKSFVMPTEDGGLLFEFHFKY